jgi:hypothetical protein
MVSFSWPTMKRLFVWTYLPSVPFTLALLALALPSLSVAAIPLTDNIWWVLKNGQVLVERGRIESSDPFTFAPHIGLDVDVQWLAQLVYYRAYGSLGLEGVVLLTALVVAATFGLLFHIAWRRTGSLAATSAGMLVAVVVAVGNLVPRAQTLALLPFAATFWLLSCAPRRIGTILALAALEALWANLHGSFFVGLVLTGVLLAGHAIELIRATGWRAIFGSPNTRFLVLALGAQAVATLATPNGLALYAYTVRLSTYSIVRQYVGEWAPTSVGQPAGLLFFASVAIAIVAFARARRGVSLTDLLLLAVFGLMGLQAVRNIIWWALVLGPLLAAACAELEVPARMAALARGAGSRRHNVLRLGVVALLAISTSPWVKAHNPLLPEAYRGVVSTSLPSGAAGFLLSQNLADHVYSDQAWGSYLDWQLWPRYELMVDSSIETHPPQVWLDVLSLDQGHVSWQEKLDTYGVDVLLLNRRRQAPLLEAVGRSAGWQAVYTDEMSKVFVRSQPESMS